MDTYRTEEEQIAAIKNFVNKNGVKVLTAIIAAIALFFAVQGWQKSQLASKENASALYNELSTAVTAGADMTTENRAVFDQAYAQLMSDYAQTVYASYAALYKAKLDVDAGDLSKAEQSLQWVVDENFNEDLKALAVLRLARVKSAAGDKDAALALLAQNPGSFAAAYEEAKGDIFLLLEKKDEALVAYKKADSLKEPGFNMSSQMLKMKIEALDNSQQDKLFPINPSVASDAEAK